MFITYPIYNISQNISALKNFVTQILFMSDLLPKRNIVDKIFGRD